MKSHKLIQGKLFTINVDPAQAKQDLQYIVPKYGTQTYFKDEELFGVAERINPKRKYLFVSKVLGRHIPVEIDDPAMNLAYKSLAAGLEQSFHQQQMSERDKILFISMAETATQMGLQIAEQMSENWNINIMHSTRSPNVDSITDPVFCTFDEGHSHATQHYLHTPATKECHTLVLIDDEFSTGNMLYNAVKNLIKAGLTFKHLITVSILDWRSNHGKLKQLATDLLGYNVTEKAICLYAGTFGFDEKSNIEVREMDITDNTVSPVQEQKCSVDSIHYKEANQHYSEGFSFKKSTHKSRLSFLYKAVKNQFLRLDLPSKARFRNMQNELSHTKKLNVLVVAVGENHYYALWLARVLKDKMKNPASQVFISSVTRSPILNTTYKVAESIFNFWQRKTLPNPNSDSVITSKKVFDFGDEQRYLYNVNFKDYDKVIFVLDKLYLTDNKEMPVGYSQTLVDIAKKHKNIVLLNNFVM